MLSTTTVSQHHPNNPSILSTHIFLPLHFLIQLVPCCVPMFLYLNFIQLIWLMSRRSFIKRNVHTPSRKQSKMKFYSRAFCATHFGFWFIIVHWTNDLREVWKAKQMTKPVPVVSLFCYFHFLFSFFPLSSSSIAPHRWQHNDNNTTKHLYPSTMSIYLPIKRRGCTQMYCEDLLHFFLSLVVLLFCHLFIHWPSHKEITSDGLMCRRCPLVVTVLFMSWHSLSFWHRNKSMQ